MRTRDADMDKLSGALVERVLVAFYARIRADERLGPVFKEIIGDDWVPHMRKIVSFWASALRLSREYRGADFMSAHLKHRTIEAAQLPIWIELFERTLDEDVPSAPKPQFMKIALAMIENLRITLDRRDRA
jgi:hemoglobin